METLIEIAESVVSFRSFRIQVDELLVVVFSRLKIVQNVAVNGGELLVGVLPGGVSLGGYLQGLFVQLGFLDRPFGWGDRSSDESYRDRNAPG
jgi:hypothetical protein